MSKNKISDNTIGMSGIKKHVFTLTSRNNKEGRLGMFGLPLPFIGKSDLPFKPVAMLKCGLPENPHCPPGMQGLVIPRPRNRVCGLADIAAFSA